LAIFNTNKDVTGFHARDSPEFDSKMGAGIFYASTVRNDLRCLNFFADAHYYYLDWV